MEEIHGEKRMFPRMAASERAVRGLRDRSVGTGCLRIACRQRQDSSGGAIPGATVTATQTETNLTREVVTNESGAYSIPNIPSGTYQVVVAVPGFRHFTARDVIVTNRDVRVDASLAWARSKKRSPSPRRRRFCRPKMPRCSTSRTREQLQTLPTSGRAFQSFMTLMPGVADPNYQQSGGINNPGRTMSLTVNGQPATNTVVRLDGITATNQFFESIQSYGPASKRSRPSTS